MYICQIHHSFFVTAPCSKLINESVYRYRRSTMTTAIITAFVFADGTFFVSLILYNNHNVISDAVSRINYHLDLFERIFFLQFCQKQNYGLAKFGSYVLSAFRFTLRSYLVFPINHENNYLRKLCAHIIQAK